MSDARGPSLTTAAPVCDLVLLTWNRPDLLNPCVERILRHTRCPCRLLIMDNASTDPEAVEFLRHVVGTPSVQVEVVRRPQNDGFAVGINDGLARTRAPWLCLLNNDVLVTEGWLPELIRVAEANPQIGLLNPMSNEFNVGPSRPDETIDEVATRVRQRQGRWLENWIGVGFGVLMARRVFEQIGYLDAQFRPLYSEDTDYSMRVRQAGLICAIAEGAYVYHHQRSTMKRDPSMEGRMRANEERFYRKWSMERPRRIAWVLKDVKPSGAARVAGQIREAANRGNRVYVYYSSRAQAGVPRHFQVNGTRVPTWGFSVQALARILSKKKGFQQIRVHQRWLAALMRACAPIHHAEVVWVGP